MALPWSFHAFFVDELPLKLDDEISLEKQVQHQSVQ